MWVDWNGWKGFHNVLLRGFLVTNFPMFRGLVILTKIRRKQKFGNWDRGLGRLSEWGKVKYYEFVFRCCGVVVNKFYGLFIFCFCLFSGYIKAYSDSLLRAFISYGIINCRFSKYFQILYIFAQILKYFAIFQHFFAPFPKNHTHALTF